MNKKIVLMLAGGALLTAAGCDLLNFAKNVGKKPATIQATDAPLSPDQAATLDPNDPVVVKVDGKPAVTKSEFLSFAEQAMKANPYLANFGITSYESAPPPIKDQLMEAMVQQKLIGEWGTDNGIANNAEFQEMRARTIKQLDQALMAQTFEKQILDDIVVGNDEVAKAYETHRERFVKEAGALNVVGAAFGDEEKANVFHHLVSQTQEGSFEQLAKEADASITEFGTISKDPRMGMSSDVPFGVRRAVFELAEDANFAQAKEGDTYWVLKVVDRTQPTYMGLEEVREQVTDMVRSEKFRTVRDERLKELRGKYTVDVDKSSLGPDGPDPLAALQEALAAQQGGEQEDRAVTATV